MSENDNKAAPEYVDDRDLAARTPIGRRAWQKWRQLGKGPPYYKVHGRVLYLWPEVLKWMEQKRTEPKKAS